MIVILVTLMGVMGCMQISEQDRMVRYLEKKYGEQFVPLGSRFGGIGNDYSILAVENSRFPGEEILVMRYTPEDSDTQYSDNYQAFRLRDQINVELHEMVSEIYGVCKVYYKVPYAALPSYCTQELTMEELLSDEKILANIYLFLSVGVPVEEKEAQLELLKQQLVIKGYQIKGSVCYIQDQEHYEKINQENVMQSCNEGVLPAGNGSFLLKGEEFVYSRWR